MWHDLLLVHKPLGLAALGVIAFVAVFWLMNKIDAWTAKISGLTPMPISIRLVLLTALAVTLIGVLYYG